MLPAPCGTFHHCSGSLQKTVYQESISGGGGNEFLSVVGIHSKQAIRLMPFPLICLTEKKAICQLEISQQTTGVFLIKEEANQSLEQAGKRRSQPLKRHIVFKQLLFFYHNDSLKAPECASTQIKSTHVISLKCGPDIIPLCVPSTSVI